MRQRALVVTSCIAAVAIAGASTLAILAIHLLGSSYAHVERTRTTLNAFSGAEDAIAAEAYAEAGYRRAPSITSRARLETALTQVKPTLESIRRVGTTRDAAVAAQLAILNQRYVDQVQTVLAGPVTWVPTTTDDRVAGPALDDMSELVESAIAGHRSEVHAAQQHQQRLLLELQVFIPVAMGLAVVALTTCWIRILRQHRRLHDHAVEQTWHAEHDDLTGLANRIPLWARLEERLALPDPDLALVLLDLDGFKEVNDTYGHPAGDAILVAVAHRIRAVLGDDDLAVRLGGDEFAVVVTPGDRGSTIHEQLQRSVEQPVEHDGIAITPRISVGVAVARTSGDRVELVRRADAALYAHKHTTRLVPAQRPAQDGHFGPRLAARPAR